jgi:hypothetical protein
MRQKSQNCVPMAFSTTPRRITWRLKDHEAFMKDQLIRNITPGHRVVVPYSYASEPLDGVTAVEDTMFRAKS